MEGIKNFLELMNREWTTVLICAGLIIGIVQKTIVFFSKSEQERIDVAKKHIQEVILRMITEAETCYEDWKNSGAIKRSQVIEEIFAQYPVLEKVADQEALIAWIDEQIDNALVTLRKIIEINKDDLE